MDMNAGASFSVGQLQEQLAVQPAFHKFVDYMCSLLEKDGVLLRDVDTFTVSPSVDDVPLPKSLHDAAMATYPKFKGLLRLLRALCESVRRRPLRAYSINHCPIP